MADVPSRMPTLTGLMAIARRWALLAVLTITYVALAKGGLALASVNPSASPIWPPTGLAIAAALLAGPSVWPAIFLGAFVANVTTAGTVVTSVAIGIGNTLEALFAAALVRRWSGGTETFGTPMRVAKFAVVSLGGTLISAAIGVGALSLAGFITGSPLTVFGTWWLGDFAGALLVVPVILLWVAPSESKARVGEVAALASTTLLVGLIAFSPWLSGLDYRGETVFLAIVPLMWAALRMSPRETATTALVLSAFSVWGSLTGEGPFIAQSRNELFLLQLMFVVSASLPSLVLSADVKVRNAIEDGLRLVSEDQDRRVELRTIALTEEMRHRLDMQSEIDRQHLHLAEAQRLANIGSWTWSPETGAIDGSEQLLEICGLDPNKADGTLSQFLELIHPEDREHAEAVIRQVALDGRDFHLEARIIRPDGGVRHVESVGEAITNANGKVVEVLGTALDVTDRRQAGAALAQAQAKLAQAQKNEAIGQLTGGIAHDFNNLLSIVLGNLEILRKRLPEDPRFEKLVQNAIHGAERGAALTGRLLAFARRQELKPEAADLGELLHRTIGLIARSVGPLVKVDLHLPDKSLYGFVDPNQLELALINLAINARDAMPNGGLLTVIAREERVDGTTSGGLAAGLYACISIVDSGEGMDEATLARATEPFFTTKGVGKGTGLGLSMAQGLAEQSGGQLVLKSQKRVGTTAELWIPLVEAPDHVPIIAPPVEPIAATRALRILVVDDDALVLIGTSSMLEDLGHTVIEASSAKDALSVLEGGKEIDLVISDYAMPDVNGVEFAARLKARWPALPFILATGYAEIPEPTARALHRLNKPYRTSDLEDAIWQVCGA